MNRKRRVGWILLFSLLSSVGVSLLPRQSMAETTAMRVVILLDNSGSMRKTDPHRLSPEAAQLFLALARPEDVVGLVAFSDRGIPLIPLAPLSSPVLKEQFQAHLRSLAFNGQITDLAAALETGLSSFSAHADKSNRDLVLLLTDGKLDLGWQRRAEEPAVLTRIREVLLPQYQQRGITLYTIAFTEEADQALLREMAQATNGAFRFVKNAAMLHKAFSELFILANHAESLPLEQGTFLVDESVQEASLVFSKRDPQEQIHLITPRRCR